MNETDHADPRQADSERVPTGVPGLDQVLQGGLQRGAAFIVSGAPGTGKTILANQIAFGQAGKGRSVLYVTLLAESHGRMLQHMRKMRFYDEDAVPDRLAYIGAFHTLEDEGLEGLMRLIHHEIEHRRADMLILDGVFVVEDQADSAQAYRRFVHELQGIAELKGCAVLLLTNGRTKDYAPEHTMVDGWMQLNFLRAGVRSFRELEVHKFRGTDFLSGAHKFCITEKGIEIFPRLEAVLQSPSAPLNYSAERLSSGVGKLDSMLGGGIRRGSTVLAIGPTGSGKTTLALHFLAEATAEEPAIFLGAYESPELLVHKARNLGLKLPGARADDSAEICWWPATEQYLDEIGHRLLEEVRRKRAKRVVIDGLNALEQFLLRKERFPAFLAALSNELRAMDVTTLLTLEATGGALGLPLAPIADLAAVAEEIVSLGMAVRDGRMSRVVLVVKARDSAFDPLAHEFEIGRGGFAIGDPAEFVWSSWPAVSTETQQLQPRAPRGPG